MRIDIITSVPELLTSPLNESILKRAQDKGLVEIVVHNLHDYAHDRRKTTDDYPFGGEAGMVMKCEPVFELVEKLQSERPYDEIIYTSPDGILRLINFAHGDVFMAAGLIMVYLSASLPIGVALHNGECNCIFLTAFFYSLITIHKKVL